VFFGRGGNDTIIGRGGRDLIFGGVGDDRILGGSGADRLYGHAGCHTILGGCADDLLSGGAGRDDHASSAHDAAVRRIAAMAILGAKTFKNYIDGEWADAASGETFESTSPADGETIGTFPKSGPEDVDRAVAAAKRAYDEWRLVPAPKRGEVLFRFAQLLAESKDDLTDLMTHEMGKVKAEAAGDVQEAIDMAYYMGGEGRRLFGQTTPSELRDKFQMSVRMPVGVVGAITPWNFPIAIPSWKTLPAIVSGNTVVFKPATDTPALGERYVELFAEAGLPPGVLNIVHGGGADVGQRLVAHPDVPIITFTGSRETGVAVTRAAAEELKHVHLELGGKNAIIVMDDADLELAVDGIVWSAFGTSGQRCTAASRVIVHDSVYDELARRLVSRVEAMRLGPGWEDDTDVGPVINRGALEKIDSYTQIGKDEGAKLLTGGEVASGNGLDKGFYYRPTIFGDVQAGMRIAQEEIFGPTTALIRVRDLDEAIRVSNGVEYGLSSSIFTGDVNKAFRAMRDLDTGITYINAGTIGAEVHLPFGGTKHTGNGHREAGQAALDVFTEWKSVYVDYSGKLQRAQIDTEEHPAP
jgi:alpha-ketoglutaric semialdehyde dehydrogenase